MVLANVAQVITVAVVMRARMGKETRTEKGRKETVADGEGEVRRNILSEVNCLPVSQRQSSSVQVAAGADIWFC